MVDRADYWAGFPVTFRAEQVALITQWLLAGESGLVVGSSGVGKSNLAGFLGGRPDVVAANMTRLPDQYCLLLLDINSLPALTAPFFYRGLYQTLQDAADQLEPQLRQTMQALNSAQVNWADSFAMLTLLQRAHRLFIRQARKKSSGCLTALMRLASVWMLKL